MPVVMGLEGTAHTVSCGIVDDNSILSNCSSSYVPPRGGIHPREAADHHADHIVPVIEKALAESGLTMKDIDLVAFSQGPGLGPCLRVVATAARTLSLKFSIPIQGVNHPLGHVEIGRKLSKAADPVMLYVSGGNTQVIAHLRGRYRVLGETTDIGLGNMLDKFARENGIPFPGGPRIEELARRGSKLLEIPYSVKGMETSFSGILTAAFAFLSKGESMEDVCYSIQEVSFAMLTEVLERALYYTNKREILLAGGVARNHRLREMVSSMAKEAGMSAYLTDERYCMDNGAMIAQAGLLMYEKGMREKIENTGINPRFRIDEVEAPWIESSNNFSYSYSGAESRVYESDFFGRPALTKERIAKSYRNSQLDRKIRTARLKNEGSILKRMNEVGTESPVLYDVNQENFSIIMERLPAPTLEIYLRENGIDSGIIASIGKSIADLHSHMMSHGDLTPNNIIVIKEKLYFIDPSMGSLSPGDEDFATDLFLISESLKALHDVSNRTLRSIRDEYLRWSARGKEIIETLEKMEKRRRYV
ncbi:bifunctional N(6)-L-threonylcarbamoyladenine synthase/serine/threonine protein kinase [Oxyplasma meridianum]|uniref:tRNA N6-adenosine threonylcarbamoyltransferase n=1 Tax=Oxyplasma meridianum TaxID=3073602 RepID=A0AAX4NIZ7_9ARCH